MKRSWCILFTAALLLIVMIIPIHEAQSGTSAAPCPFCGDTQKGTAWTHGGEWTPGGESYRHFHQLFCNNCLTALTEPENCIGGIPEFSCYPVYCTVCGGLMVIGCHSFTISQPVDVIFPLCSPTTFDVVETCRICGKRETFHYIYPPSPLAEHTPISEPGQSATCTETGLTEGSKCSACGTILIKQEIISALGHSFTNYISDGNATCSTDGTKTAVCDRTGCGAMDTLADLGSALVHSFTNHISDGNATCTLDGTKTAVCDRCAQTDTMADIGSTLGHDWGTWVSNGDGTHTHTCSRDSTHQDTASCNYVDTVTPPTCTETGYMTSTCTMCGYSHKDTPVDALGHDWGAWVINGDGTHTRTCANDTAHTETAACAFSSVMTPPNCAEDGYTTFTCKECGYSYQDNIITKTGHDWGDWTHVPSTSGTSSLNRRVCGNDQNHTEMANCTFGSAVTPPNCTEDEYATFTCTVCGYVYAAVPVQALGHTPGDWEVTLPPTNKKAGLQVKRCTRCGVTLEKAKMPLLSETWPDSTACSFGSRFRDEAPELTDKWYMYTPIDLRKEGVVDVPLIASNRYRIGIAQVSLKDGQVSATYKITANKVQIKHEFMAFLPGLEGLKSVEPEALEDRAVPFGAQVEAAYLGGSEALFFIWLVVTYDIYADGVQWWSMP
jgi:hypothetical protein